MTGSRSAHPMRLVREATTLMVIDVQERLFPAMDADHREEVVKHIKVLAAAAKRLTLPTITTEQDPKGLGHTLLELRETLPAPVDAIAKVDLSCGAVEAVRTRLAATGRRQIVMAGIEAHVGVLMSALDLQSEGYAVHVVADAVTSRTQSSWRIAMHQLRAAGIVVTSTETVLFQLVAQSDTEDYRALARLIR